MAAPSTTGKRQDGKRQEQGKAKQDGGVNPKKSRTLQKSAATTQEPTHKDSVSKPCEKRSAHEPT